MPAADSRRLAAAEATGRRIVEMVRAVGGPLAAVRTRDIVRLSVRERKIGLEIPESELQQRLAAWRPAKPPYRRGYYTIFTEHVLQAHEGCDFDFLRAQPSEAPYDPQIGRS